MSENRNFSYNSRPQIIDKFLYFVYALTLVASPQCWDKRQEQASLLGVAG